MAKKENPKTKNSVEKRKTIIVTDPKDKRLKAYNDSNALYNKGLMATNPLLKKGFKVDTNEWNDFSNKIKDKKTGEKVSVSKLNNGKYKILDKSKVYSPNSNIKPTSYLQLTRKGEDRPMFGDEYGSMFATGNDYWYSPQWDKPVQPVVYQKPKPKPVVKTPVKTPVKPPVKTPVKPVAKTVVKPVQKPAPKPVVKEEKTVVKAEIKPAQKPVVKEAKTLYQGRQFMDSTGLIPNLYTKSEVANAARLIKEKKAKDKK
jgi:hypothetical protein